jgi:hypothetical protein
VKDRETGFIVEGTMRTQLAQALLRLLEDDALRETMGRAGRKRALTYSTWGKIAATMLRRIGSFLELVLPCQLRCRRRRCRIRRHEKASHHLHALVPGMPNPFWSDLTLSRVLDTLLQ